MARPNLHAGQDNLAVRALQTGLHNALANKARNKKNGVYGINTIRDVEQFERRHGVQPVSGRSFGPAGWKAIDRHLGRAGKYYISRYYFFQRKKISEARRGKMRDVAVAEALWGVAHNGELVYVQFRPMAPSLRSPLARRRTDCSSYVTLCYKAAGAPDPNGQNYNGLGYTGTLQNNGKRITLAQMRKGDLVFYGLDRNGITTHVAMAIDSSRVASFGGEPGPRILPVGYRPIVMIRSYLP